LLLLVVPIFIAGVALAHGPGWRDGNRNWRNNNWKDMDQHYSLMHDSQVKAEKTEKGVKLEVTAQSKDVQSLIKKELLDKQDELKSYFKGVDVAVNSMDTGVEVTLNADDSQTVEQLQHDGDGLIYQYLRDTVHGAWSGRGGHHGHHGNRGNWGGCWDSDGKKWNKGPVGYLPGNRGNDNDSYRGPSDDLM